MRVKEILARVVVELHAYNYSARAVAGLIRYLHRDLQFSPHNFTPIVRDAEAD
jgi:hypothetical protein